jgi:hypothetical protein
VRLGLARSLAPCARLFHDIFDGFSAFGSERGGMTVKVEGVDARGRSALARWSLRADGDGPNIPILPALALIRQWSKQLPGDAGAKVCAGLLDLAALETEFARLKIRTRTETWPGKEAPVLAQAMGGAFDTMPSLVRHIHAPISRIELEGRVDIDGAANWVGAQISRFVGFAGTARDLPAVVAIERAGISETWTRRFGTDSFTSRMSTARFGGLYESFGPITLGLEAQPSSRGFALAVKNWWLGPIPLPRFLMPTTRARAGLDDQARYTFDVWIGMPLVGRLIHYRGWLMEAAVQPVIDSTMTNNLAGQPLAKSATHG